MKKNGFITAFLYMTLVACAEKPVTKLYKNASATLLLEIERTSDDNNLSDSLLILRDIKENRVVKTGFFKDGFMNGKWLYNNINRMETIVWARYKDKYLNFETNVFEYADTILHADHACELVFRRNNERLALDISLNGPAKDAFSSNDYSSFRQKAMQQLNEDGMQLLSFDSLKLMNKSNEIMVFTIKAKDKLTGEERISKTAFGPIDSSHFIGVSTGSVMKNDFYVTELFNGVLTTISIDGKQLYVPIKDN